jgi:hypothetical protein
VIPVQLDRAREPHEPGPFCRDTHCHIHHVDELYAEGASYCACLECGHVYRSAEDLLLAYAEHYPPEERGEALSREPAKIYSCPLCSHDF